MIGCAICKPDTANIIIVPKMVDIHCLTLLCLTFLNKKLYKNDKTKNPTYTVSSENIFSYISHPQNHRQTTSSSNLVNNNK